MKIALTVHTIKVCLFGALTLFLLTLPVQGYAQSRPSTLDSVRQQEIMTEQERKAEQYAKDPKIIRGFADKYPTRNREVLEVYAKGVWLCDSNGYPDSEGGAPTRELRAMAYDRGLEYVKQAIQMDPTFPELFVALGEFLNTKSIRLANNHFTAQSNVVRTEALESFQKALKLDPSNPDVYFGIARTTPSSDLDERIRNLLIIETLNPQYRGVHSFLAANYEMKGDFELAAQETLKTFDDAGEPAEKVDRLERLAQESKHYSFLLQGYLALVDRDPRTVSFDRVLFAISPFRAKMLKESPSLNLESLVDHRELADFLVKVGSMAAQKQQAWLGSPLHQVYKRSAERDSSLAGVRPPQDLSGIAEQYFRKALELDPTKAEEIRKIAEASQLDELKKFARELPR